MPKFLTLGLPDEFIQHGEMEQLCASVGLDPVSVAKKISAFVKGQ
jgi:deoxyxylulose-5-phosphate synthase